MKLEDWARQWEQLASADQKDMQFFLGREQPTTWVRGTMAYIDPTCSCKPHLAVEVAARFIRFFRQIKECLRGRR